MNLGDDYRVHLDAAHGIMRNFNFFMQEVWKLGFYLIFVTNISTFL